MVNLGIISLDHPHATGNHLPALQYMADRIRVAGIAHPNAGEAAPWLERTGARLYESRDALLADKDIHAVLVTSKNNRHAEDSIAAAKAGKTVFCDKPIGLTPEECLDIVHAVRESGVDFLTTFPVRFNRAVRQAKEMVQSGALGEIRAIMATNHGCMYQPGVPAWVLDPAANGGGCLIDHTVHVADIIRWMTGQEFSTVRVEARTAALNKALKAEDIAVLHGTLEDGTLYQIDASWNRRATDPVWGDVTFRIVGSRGSVCLDIYNNQHLRVFSGGRDTNYYPNLIVYEHGCIFDDYCRHAAHGTPLAGASAVDGLRTIELVAAGYASIQTGETVRLARADLQAGR